MTQPLSEGSVVPTNREADLIEEIDASGVPSYTEATLATTQEGQTSDDETELQISSDDEEDATMQPSHKEEPQAKDAPDAAANGDSQRQEKQTPGAFEAWKG